MLHHAPRQTVHPSGVQWLIAAWPVCRAPRVGMPNAAVDSAEIERRLENALLQEGQVVHQQGGVAAVFDSAERIIEATYDYPFMEHAPMEPMNATLAMDFTSSISPLIEKMRPKPLMGSRRSH